MFKLTLWSRQAETPPKPEEPAPTGDAGVDSVNRLIEAKMNLIRAGLEARAALLRAQAEACDSVATKAEIGFRADEAEFIIAKFLR